MPRAATLMAKASKRVGITFERSKRSKRDQEDEKRRLQSRAKRAQSIHVNADSKNTRTYCDEKLGRRETSRGVDQVGYSRKNSKVKYDSKTETIRSVKPRTMWVTKHKETAKSVKVPNGKLTSKDLRNGLFTKRGSNKSEFNTRSDRSQNVRTAMYAQKTAKKIVRDDKSLDGNSEEVRRDGKKDVRNGLFKKLGSEKSEPNMLLDRSQNAGTVVYPQKTAKKTVRDNKLLDGNSKEQEVKPKKRKRIQLDPYDISNKRLDDDEVVNEGTIEKKKDPEKMAEMSKNAQFRAIQPSSSILSYVEDNLLGRRRLIEIKRAGYNIELPSPLDNIPFSKSTERENIEENIFRNKLEFSAAAKVSSSFPPPEVSEIAFAGRSNVGKSSLLNALTRQWGVVRTSDKPGHTQSINFFNLGPKISLVDLPGYGFAYAKEDVKDAWEGLVKEYVSTRVNLKRVCLLVDTKWGMKPRDRELIDLMERYQTKYQIVLTKTDTVFPIDVARRAMQIEENLKGHKSAVQPLMMVSSKSGAGVRCLRTVLSKIARFAKF